MEILEKLKDQGWYLTEEGLKKFPDNTDPKKIISAALDFDFRDIAGGALPPELSKKDESFPGRIVLQVQKVRNISAPKANEESKTAPRFLQVELSDGVTLVQALELEHISVLNLNTPPGTKIYFKGEKIPLMQGMIVMRPLDIQLLGGKVAALVEKWEMVRSLQKYAKSGRIQSGSSGPPPWIQFGQKLQQTVSADKNFKSLAQAQKEKNAKENEEFNAMRSEAIAEAAKVGAKKIFGGGNHQILDHNVKKILEKGYSEEEAKNALRSTGNSLERALYNLKRRGEDEFKSRDEFRDKSRTLPIGGRRGHKELGKRGKEIEVAGEPKPAGNVSLFDFLTDKLPANADQPSLSTSTAAEAPTFTSSQNSKYESYSRPMTKAGSEPSSKPYFHHSSSSSHNYQQHDRRQDTSSSVKSQDQSNSNRPKFENNLSSSFATRNSPYPNDERYNRYSTSNRGGRGGGGNPFRARPNQHFEESSEYQRNSGAYSSGRGGRVSYERGSGSSYNGGGPGASSGGYENRRYNEFQNQKEQQNQHRQERDQNQPPRNGFEQKAANGKGASTSRFQHQKETSSNTYQSNSGNVRNYDNNRQSNYNASGNNNNNANQNNNNNNSANTSNSSDNSTRMNKLVEGTSKLRIEKTRAPPRAHQQNYSPQQNQQQSKQNQPQQQPPMNSTTSKKLQQTFGSLPNGFNYDPSKIIGFQAKETNEFALTLLKSQGVPTGQLSQASQPQYVSGPPPAAIRMAPQPFNTATFVTGPPPTHSPTTFGINPGENWNWKIGDRCLAKYWDDGRYYEAEITGISDKTCVVLFIEYGNHEEVLKADCLPITDAQHRTVNFSSSIHNAPVVSVDMQSMPCRGLPNRYRGERRMYVPPPKREN